MERKPELFKIWQDICDNCERREVTVSGVKLYSTRDALRFIERAEKMEDKFILATRSHDKVTIETLYDSIQLNDYQKEMISKLREHNEHLLLTLNPFVLNPKFEFLTPVIDELVVDCFAQEQLLSLNEYEISVLKRIVDYSVQYGINPREMIAKLLNNIGYDSTCSFEESADLWLNKIDDFFEMLHSYELTNGEFDEKVIGNIACALRSGFIPKVIGDVIDYNGAMKARLKELIEGKDISVEELKEHLIRHLFSMDMRDAQYVFAEHFSIDGVPEEYYMSPGVVELRALKMLLETDNIDKLKKIAREIINDPDFEITPFNNALLEENLLLIYAKEFNKCRPNFDDGNLICVKEGIKLYDSGNDFYAIVKVLGAFSEEGKKAENYYLEWNNKRYGNHVNSVSLIRNDNLAFAEIDGKPHIKLGFLNFGEKMFLGGGNQDLGANEESLRLQKSVYVFHLCFPEKLIDITRKWHNELAYERKNIGDSSGVFKKNPDFIILDLETQDISLLEPEEQKIYKELLADSLQAAKDFGNIPILVIDREKIAKNEIKVIWKMLDDYIVSCDFDLLKKIVVRFCNNRNGCRGPQHKYIRENYFSDAFFQNLLNDIYDVILAEHKQEFKNFVTDECKKLKGCSYDKEKTTENIPTSSNRKN
jgi:hypothetical protein